MQVANALNNIIRILFNPKVESFKLFDILLVKSDDKKYLAQIVDIYDDKFDSSQNVAKLKLFFKINEKNQVVEYDNFTPNKECEVERISQAEVAKFINDTKKTFPFGTNTASETTFNIQQELFSNNPVIFADKMDCANEISIAISKNLSDKKALIVDFTGVIDFEGADKIKAVKDFRLPLNYFTLDFVFDKFLSDATLEFQAVGNEILKALKKFAQASEGAFIPFNVFTKAIKEQYKATPHAELKLFLSRLDRCQLDNVFAKNKNDSKNFYKSLAKNSVTILDLSNLNGFFQKLYFEYLIDDIKDDVYLLTRINDENFDTGLINKIYNKKPNISFIPNLSFNYKKLPSILQYSKNYIMFPSLYQRIDFLGIDTSLASLITDGCLIFGENTNNFIYYIRDYALKPEERRRNYRTISLSLADNLNFEQNEIKQINPDNALKRAKENYNPTPDSKKLMRELSIPENNIEVDVEDEALNQQIGLQDDIDSIKEEITVEHNVSETFVEEELNVKSDDNQSSNVEEISDDNVEQEVVEEIENKEEIHEEKIDFDESLESKEYDKYDALDEEDDEQEDEQPQESIEEKQEFDGTFSKELKEIASKDFQGDVQEDIEDEPEETEIQEAEIQKDELKEDEPQEDELQADVEEKQEDEPQQDLKKIEEEPQREVETIHFSDEELDFFNADKKTPAENFLDSLDEENETLSLKQEQNNVESVMIDDIEYKTQNDIQDNKKKDEIEHLNLNLAENNEDELDLSEVANNSIDESFEQIINEKSKDSKPTIEITDDVKIEEESSIKSDDSLPIFKETVSQTDKNDDEEYSTGDIIVHKKYGKGKIIKTIKYEHRQLLQIEFEESGKKLLDPVVADIKLEQ